MSSPVEAVLLRVFVGESDRFHGRPLADALVMKALERKMAGATVLPGPRGFGRSRRIHSEINVDAAPRSPVVVEIVDAREKIDAFLPAVDEMVETGLVTLEIVQALFYSSDKRHRPAPARRDR
jgi:PII-like signaling protein